MLTFFYILAGCAAAFILILTFSSKPYPKELEEKENEELKKKFDEYEKRSQE